MSALKRAKSLTDFFRPTPRTRATSPSRHVPSIVSPSTTSTLSPSDTAARPGDPFQHRGVYDSDPVSLTASLSFSFTSKSRDYLAMSAFVEIFYCVRVS